MHEIGSIFPVDSCESHVCGKGLNLGSTVRLYSLCREALFDLLTLISPGRKTALLPAYTCSTVIDPFRQLGWNISFYSVHKDLSLDLDSVREQVRTSHPSVAVFHPYYGMDYSADELAAIRALKDGGCFTVEDVTQSLLAPAHKDAFSYRVGSVRKWLSVPDGAFLDADLDMDEPSEAFDSFYIPQLVAMRLRAKYFETGDYELKDLSIKLNKCAVRHTHEPLSAHAVSDYTRSVLANFNIEGSLAPRWDNFRILLDGLKGCPGVELPINDMQRLAAPPFTFPCMLTGIGSCSRRKSQRGRYMHRCCGCLPRRMYS